jgi:hypothetical protein
VFSLPPSPTVAALAEFAWELICEAFGPVDPAVAHRDLPVDEYVKVLGPLKTGFTHHPRSKELLRAMLVELGCDPSTTYFDVPKLRVVTPAAYLSAGLGYNYQPHRDTWYSAPMSQVNWWAPIRNVSAERCMAFHPDYWQVAAENSSETFDPYEWNKSGRRNASTFITSDPRPHPHLIGDRGPGAEVRLVGRVGSILAFSAAQLHATVPNLTDLTRFSFDVRTVNIADLADRAGAPRVDERSTGTTLRDFLRADDYSQLPADVISAYDDGEHADGVLVFDPGVLTT